MLVLVTFEAGSYVIPALAAFVTVNTKLEPLLPQHERALLASILAIPVVLIVAQQHCKEAVVLTFAVES